MTEPSLVDLVGVGLNATDTLIPLPQFPERGSKVEYPNASIMPGGQTAIDGDRLPDVGPDAPLRGQAGR